MKKQKWIWTTAAILGIAGGIEHAAAGFTDYSLLDYLGSYAPVIQGIAGVATVIFIWNKLK